MADIEILKPFENLENCSWTENLYGSTPSFQDPVIVSGTWQAGSISSDLEGCRKRTKSASASMGGKMFLIITILTFLLFFLKLEKSLNLSVNTKTFPSRIIWICYLNLFKPGPASPYPTSSLIKTRSRSPGDSDDEEKCTHDDENQSGSDWSVDNDSSSTSLIEVTDHLEIDRL